VWFNRPPGEASRDSILVIDAMRDAIHHRPTLWRRHIDENTPWTVDVGLIMESNGAAHVDFDTDRVLTIAGDTDTAACHGRSLIIEMVTQFGPSDLEVIIATTPEDLGDWDWTKWLPHARLGGEIALLSNELELATFAQQRTAATRHRALLLVTDDALWAEADAPLRSLVLDGPAHMGILALTTSAASAPASTGTLIDHHVDGASVGTARLVRVARNGAEMNIHAPLLSMSLAARAARRLAPLRDPNLAAASTQGQTTDLPQTLGEFVGFDEGGGSSRANWRAERPGADVALPVGTLADTTVAIDLGTNRGVVVSGSSIDEATELVRTLTLSMAAAWSPLELTIVTVDHRTAHVDTPLQHLPHNGGVLTHRGTPAGLRFVERVRNRLARRSEQQRRLVVIVNGPAQTELAAPGLLAALSGLAKSHSGSAPDSDTETVEAFHLIFATHLPLASLDANVREVCPLEITVDHVGGLRRATLHDRQSGLHTPFTPFEPHHSDTDALRVRPMVFGRPLTALERQLERRVATESTSGARDDQVEFLVNGFVEHARRIGIDPVASLVSKALPDELGANDLFEQYRGDGIPLGMVERLDGGDPEMYWWQPGANGSRLLLGSPRSGTRGSADTMIRGAIERFSADDLHLYVIDHSDSRRRSVAPNAHVGGAVSPDREADVEALLALLQDELQQRSGGGSPRPSDIPTLLLIVRDIDRLDHHSLAAIQSLLTGGSQVGIHVFATATRYTDIADVVSAFPVVIVGELTDTDDYVPLGVEEPAALVRHPGRCISVPDQRLLQLGASSAPLESVLRGIASEVATTYPPRRVSNQKSEPR
jgi:S-DNA-T family DNA segregation ATPase FtsK/SpoIIIE